MGLLSVTPSWPLFPLFGLQLLKFPLGPCPRYEQLQNETRQTLEYQNERIQNAVSGAEVDISIQSFPWGSTDPLIHFS